MGAWKLQYQGFRMATVALLAVILTGCGGGGGGGGNPVISQPPPPAPPPPAPTRTELVTAASFAARASFGLPWTDIETLARDGQQAWLEAQFALPPGYHTPIVDDLVARRERGEFAAFEDDVEYLIAFRRMAWWHQAVTSPDVLRQRVAFALSEIFVVSDKVDALLIYPEALSGYYDVLLEHAFGNYRDLLRAVTLSPAMGIYLSHVNNRKADPVRNTFPDENYAREVMQLFTIGLFEMNPDGTRRLDAGNQPIPTYSNAEIREFAKIFTGLSYGQSIGSGPSFFGREDPVLNVPMEMFEAYHEPGQKMLLNGLVVPDGQTGMADIDDALDNLFNHPNVGPFIGRLLIQRLVTSNPSPEYVARVSAAFNGDGGTPRGDMETVLRAILLDPEAEAGVRLREPFLRYLHLNRGLNVTSSDTTWPGYGFVAQFLTQQHVLSAPSVFNFYLPDFSPAGELGDAGLTAPEFQITNASTIVGMTNLIAYALFSAQSIDTPDGFAALTLDLSDYEDLADDPDALIDRIDLVFFANSMDAATRNAILTALQPLAGDLTLRAQVALYLALASPAYAIQGGAS